MARKKRRRNVDDSQDHASEGHSLGPPSKKQHLDSQTQDQGQDQPQLQLPEGVFHYTSTSDIPWDIQHYWRQRHKIFTKYDHGIWMTNDAWFGVTPEPVAKRIADHIELAAPGGRAIILDAFCGAGGNTIAFARSGKWKRVYAIEKDPATLACAKQNAKVYGVADRITWFEGDCFEVLGVKDGPKGQNYVKELPAILAQFGVIFASPPWGGPGYKHDEVFDLNAMQPYGLDDMWWKLSQVTGSVALYLPRTSDLRQLAACVEKDKEKRADVVHYCTGGSSRALCAYLGEWKWLEV